MKSKQVTQGKSTKRYHSAEFKDQALMRMEQEGAAATARVLELKPTQQLYAWRSAKKLRGQTSEEQRLMQSDYARLKRIEVAQADRVSRDT